MFVSASELCPLDVVRLRNEELELERRPPALDDLETDANRDGIPDGWYNARDVRLMDEGGAVGPHFVRFERKKALPGRARDAQPRVRDRRHENRRDRDRDLGTPGRTSSSVSERGPSPVW